MSLHHQGVDEPGEGVVLRARAPDGVVEALWVEGACFAVGLEWHPEYQREPGMLDHRPLLEALLQAAQ